MTEVKPEDLVLEYFKGVDEKDIVAILRASVSYTHLTLPTSSQV